jgi:lipopolysaccharide transport system permease protein
MELPEATHPHIPISTPSRQRAHTAASCLTVYTPNDRVGLGLEAWRDMAKELVDSRELTWRLFLRDFSARYRQSVLGYVWAVVPVLLTVVTFTWLNCSNVLAIGGTALPYPLFVLLGMTVWQLFASGLTGATQSLVNAGSLITKINFPRETLVLAAFGQSLFEFCIRAALVAGGFALWRTAPSWTILLIPAALVPLCLFTMGLGYLLALVNGVMRDAGQLVTFLLTFWMFLTPVVYPAPAKHGHAMLQALNPVSPFVTASQDLATRHSLSQPYPYAVACAISVVVFLFGWRVFHLTETRIAERV